MPSSFWNKLGIHFGTPSYSAKCLARQEDIEYTKYLIRHYELLSDWEEECAIAQKEEAARNSPQYRKPKFTERFDISQKP